MMNYLETTFGMKDRTILVTGASSGIGKHIALDLAKCGAKVFVSGRDQSRLQATLELLDGEGHQSMVCDITNEAQIDDLVERLPMLDGFVHCAGVLGICPISHVESDDLENQYRVNHLSAVLLSQKIIRHKLLLPEASVVFISSVSAHKPSVGFGIYSASKAALEAFARVFALEVSGKGIRVNCVAPGMVHTPMFEYATDLISEETMTEHEKEYPLGFANPQDVSPAVLFLLSKASQKITGVTITIDGGYSL